MLAIGVLLAPSSAAAGGLRTGFLDPAADASRGTSNDLSTDLDATMKAAHQSGAKIIRLYAYWNRLLPGTSKPGGDLANPSNPAYDWGSLDDQVTAASVQGFDIMLTLRSAPRWAQGDCGSGHATWYSRGSCKPSPGAFQMFAEAISKHYASNARVKYWGMWNEPNLPSFLAPQFERRNGHRVLTSPSRYRKLLNYGARGVRSGDPGGFVIGGETAPFTNYSKSGRMTNPGPLGFLRKLLCMSRSGKKVCRTSVRADIWSTHPYTSGNPWHHAVDKDSVSFGDLPQWKRLVNAAVRAGQFRTGSGAVKKSMRLWNTEFSWDTKPPDDQAVPIKLHARWTAEALYRTWTLGIEALIWLQLRDYPLGDIYQSGLYRYQSANDAFDLPKLSLTAFRFPFVAYASSGRIKIWGRTPDSNAHMLRIERKTSSGWHVVKSVSANGAGIFTKSWSSGDRTSKYRARLANTNTASVGFSLVRPADKFVNPFGGP